jgi:transaldolase / glucose-6-phosphate isomerase
MSLGLCLLLTADSPKDLPVPGAPYSFGQLQRALALGEFQALVAGGHFVVRLHLASSSDEDLAALEQLMEQSLRRYQR